MRPLVLKVRLTEPEADYHIDSGVFSFPGGTEASRVCASAAALTGGGGGGIRSGSVSTSGVQSRETHPVCLPAGVT